MSGITINKKYLTSIINDKDILELSDKLEKAFDNLHMKLDLCQSGTGWVSNISYLENNIINRVNEVSEKIKQREAFIVIGIGGSYLGSKAVIEALTHSFYNKLKTPEIYFAGHNVDPTYLNDLIEVIKEKDTVINVISKSGTTLETLLTFRVLKKILFKKYGKSANERIIITTDEKKGQLRKYAERNNIESFIVPDDIGGRYSVLTPVGLLPIAVSGINIKQLLKGASKLAKEYCTFNINHPYIQYSAMRYLLSSKGKNIEVLISYIERMRYFSEWYKQLFAESEGKDGKGVFPTSLIFSTDLHSFGQYIQQGRKNFFETTMSFKNLSSDIEIEVDEDNLGGFDFLAGYKYSDVLTCVKEGTLRAHHSGGAPNIVIEIEKLDEYYLGQLLYFFEKACAISSLLNEVNPFNQPGVEEYKTNVKDRLKELSQGTI